MDGVTARRSRVAGNTPSSTQTRLLLLVSIRDQRVTVTTGFAQESSTLDGFLCSERSCTISPVTVPGTVSSEIPFV